MKAAVLLLAIALILSAEQYVQYDQVYVWKGSSSRVLIKFDGPLEWNKGTMYRRLEVVKRPTQLSACLQVCVWSGGETCSPCKPNFSKIGDVIWHTSKPSSWWKKDGGGAVNWSSNGKRAFVVKAKSGSGKWIATGSGWWVMGSSATQHLPIELKITQILVTNGSLECPKEWMGEAPDSWGCGSVDAMRENKAIRKSGNGLCIRQGGTGWIISAPDLRTISLFSVDGRLAGSFKDGRQQILIPRGSISPGLYLLHAKTGAGSVKSALLVDE